MKQPLQTVRGCAPCGQHCLCVPTGSGLSTCTVYATLEYEVDGRKKKCQLAVTVPPNLSLGYWMGIFACKTRDLIKPQGARHGWLTFRLDGSKEPLTWWQAVQDVWYRWTWRGKQHTGNHFVPIWPDPPPPPRRPRAVLATS